MLRAFVIFFLISVPSHSMVLAQTDPGAADYRLFSENSFARYQSGEAGNDPEHVLYDLIREHTPNSHEQIRNGYADYWKISQEDAEKHIRVLLNSAKVKKIWDDLREKDERLTCELVREHPFYDALNSLVNIKKGEYVYSRVVGGIRLENPYDCFDKVINKNQNPNRILVETYRYTRDVDFILPILIEDPLFQGIGDAVLRGYYDNHSPFARLELLERIIEKSSKADRLNDDYLKIYAAYFSHQAQFGSIDAAFDVFQKLETDQISKLHEIFKDEGGIYGDFYLNLISVLILKGENDKAFQYLKRYDETLIGRERQSFEIEILSEILKPKLAKNELFDQFFYGKNFNLLLDEDENITRNNRDRRGGWKGNLDHQYNRSIRLAVIKHLEVNEFHDIGRHVEGRFFFRLNRHSNVYEKYRSVLGDDFFLNAKKRERDFNEFHKSRINGGLNDDVIDLSYLDNEEKPEVFTQYDLESEFIPGNDEERLIYRLKDTETLTRLRSIGLPVPWNTIVRAQWIGDEIVIIYGGTHGNYMLGTFYGEYFAIRSQDGGKTWGKEINTGVVEGLPYVVSEFSALPLWDGESLSIEVSQGEAIRSQGYSRHGRPNYKIHKEGIYLKAKWDDLEKDSDGDGLTDVFEHRYGLSIDADDTDGDSIKDGIDYFPHVPYAEIDDELKVIARAIYLPHRFTNVALPRQEAYGVNKVDHDKMTKGDINLQNSSGASIIEAPPEYISAFTPINRSIVIISNKLKERLETYAPVRTDSQVEVFVSPDGERFHVIWAGQGEGGKLTIYKTNTGWKTYDHGMWMV